MDITYQTKLCLNMRRYPPLIPLLTLVVLLAGFQVSLIAITQRTNIKSFGYSQAVLPPKQPILFFDIQIDRQNQKLYLKNISRTMGQATDYKISGNDFFIIETVKKTALKKYKLSRFHQNLSG